MLSSASWARPRAPSSISSSDSGIGGAPKLASKGTISAPANAGALAARAPTTRRTASTLGPRVLPTTMITFGGLLDALDVGAGGGVDADPLPLADEGGDLHDESRLHLGRLADVGDRRALQGRLRLHDRHLHRERELDADGTVLVHLDLELDVRDEVGHRVAQHLLGVGDVLVRHAV